MTGRRKKTISGGSFITSSPFVVGQIILNSRDKSAVHCCLNAKNHEHHKSWKNVLDMLFKCCLNAKKSTLFPLFLVNVLDNSHHITMFC